MDREYSPHTCTGRHAHSTPKTSYRVPRALALEACPRTAGLAEHGAAVRVANDHIAAVRGGARTRFGVLLQCARQQFAVVPLNLGRRH